MLCHPLLPLRNFSPQNLLLPQLTLALLFLLSLHLRLVPLNPLTIAHKVFLSNLFSTGRLRVPEAAIRSRRLALLLQLPLA